MRRSRKRWKGDEEKKHCFDNQSRENFYTVCDLLQRQTSREKRNILVYTKEINIFLFEFSSEENCLDRRFSS